MLILIISISFKKTFTQSFIKTAIKKILYKQKFFAIKEKKLILVAIISLSIIIANIKAK